jgi:hypothetical protein
MTNQEYTDLLLQSDDVLRKLVSGIEGMLSQEDVDYTITIGDHVFDLSKPVTHEEKEEYEKQKKMLIGDLLAVTFNSFIDTLNDEPSDNRLRSIWGPLASLQVLKPKSKRVDSIVNEEVVPITETSKPLDMSNPFVIAQNKNLSEEEKVAILIKGIDHE